MFLFHSEKVQGSVVPNDRIDLEKLCRSWYEIAAIKTWMTRAMTHTVVTYTQDGAGGLLVDNKYRQKNAQNEVQSKITFPHPEKAKMKQSFPMLGGLLVPSIDMWIWELDEDYEWMVLGSAKPDQCWVLASTPALDDAVYEKILEKCREKGIHVKNLEKTDQQ
eukprot:TRINITY_DN3211_c0_g1_i1.p1 TRINITY_DN3211_c0_g1~~TRINITY_DN3211_c0_g1_i1.p1  ORF type:complete len:163 (+),score=33.81 TRINITY_DN3211_c0_g1_i1:43-531(+)